MNNNDFKNLTQEKMDKLIHEILLYLKQKNADNRKVTRQQISLRFGLTFDQFTIIDQLYPDNIIIFQKDPEKRKGTDTIKYTEKVYVANDEVELKVINDEVELKVIESNNNNFDGFIFK
jgi:hypothetical protein